MTQGPSCENDFVAFTQGPIEWLQRQFSAVNDGVRDTLRAPFDEVINFLKDEDVMASVRMLAERAQDGTFKVVFGLDFESLSPVILILLVLTLPFLSRVQVVVLVSLFSLFCVFKPSSISLFGRYLFDRIKSFVGFGSDVVQDALSFSTCYRFIVPVQPAPTSGSRGYLAYTHSSRETGVLSVQVPYQCTTRVTPIRYHKDLTDIPEYNAPMPKLTITTPSGAAGFTRAFGDDFQALFFVGIPRLAVRAD